MTSSSLSSCCTTSIKRDGKYVSEIMVTSSRHDHDVIGNDVVDIFGFKNSVLAAQPKAANNVAGYLKADDLEVHSDENFLEQNDSIVTEALLQLTSLSMTAGSLDKNKQLIENTGKYSDSPCILNDIQSKCTHLFIVTVVLFYKYFFILFL